MLPLAQAALRLVGVRSSLAPVELFIGRNLDNALLAVFARWLAASSAPLVYEVLDVNRSCTEMGWRGALLRRLEKWLLARIDLLVVSSPYFATAYYERVLQYQRSWFVFENKIPQWARPMRAALPDVKSDVAPLHETDRAGRRQWRIGWFGYLDDEKSWGILRRLAERLRDDVTIYVRGMPYTNFDTARFLADVERLDNVSYGGPYRSPEDLAEVYNAVDIVWSTDCNVPHANSKWLLTNGVYEAGYFGKPVIGLIGTAVGEFLASWGSGWCVNEPMEENLIDFIRNLTVEQYEAKRAAIAGLSADVFVETDEIERIWTILQHQNALRKMRVHPANGSSRSC